MIATDELAGMTSDSAILEKEINEHDDYDEAISELTRSGISVKEIYEVLTIEDVQHAADLLRVVYDESNVRDGFLITPISWVYALWILAYALVWFVINDVVKILTYRMFRRVGVFV